MQNEKEICMCDCHRTAFVVKHTEPCCELTDKKYLSVCGELDLEKFTSLSEELIIKHE